MELNTKYTSGAKTIAKKPGSAIRGRSDCGKTSPPRRNVMSRYSVSKMTTAQTPLARQCTSQRPRRPAKARPAPAQNPRAQAVNERAERGVKQNRPAQRDLDVQPRPHAGRDAALEIKLRRQRVPEQPAAERQREHPRKG